MLKTYKILSVLLDYPDETFAELLPSSMEIVRKENILYYTLQSSLEQFVAAASALSLAEWQMLYVQQFDCSKTVNLYLFDHIYGDSRQRGQAMVDMKEMYARSGLSMSDGELPDFLPLFLEYLSTLGSAHEAATLLSNVRHILVKIREKLEKEDSFYRHLFVILEELAETESKETCTEIITKTEQYERLSE